MVDRLEWSRKRVWSLGIATGTSTLILGCLTAQAVWADLDRVHPLLWMTTFANVIQWIAYLCVTLRVGLHADMLKRVDRLREQIREETRTEVAKLLKPIDSKIEEIDADVHAYGDQREAAGAAAGTALALQIVGQRSKTGRHLNPVD